MSEENPIINLSSLFTAPTLSGIPSTIPSTTSGEVHSFFAMDSLSSTASTIPPTGSGIVATVPILQPGRISIAEFSKSVVTSLNNFKKTANESDTIEDIKAKERWYDAGALSSLMIKVRAEIDALSGQESDFFAQEEAELLEYVTGPFADYNSTLDTATADSKAMYDAQVLYNSQPVTPATTADFNAAVLLWNNNLTGLNNSLSNGYAAYLTATNAQNDQIDANNLVIDQLNAARVADQITAQIPHQQRIAVAPPPSPFPLPSVAQGPPSTDPTVPAGYADIPTPTVSIVSTSIVVSPLTTAEAALLDSISASFDSINSGSLYNLDSELAKATSKVKELSASGADFATYLAYANATNSTLTTVGQAYINSVTSFNASLGSINAQINAFNATRLLNGEEPIPKQLPIPVPTLASLLLPTTPPSPPTANFYPNIKLVVPATPSGSVTPTNSTNYLNTYYNPVFETQLALLNSLADSIALTEAYRDFKVYFLRGLSNVQNANVAQSKVASNASVALGSAGTGAALTANILGLQSSSLTSVLSNAILKTAQLDAGITNSSGIVESLTVSALNALINASLASGIPAAALVSNQSGLNPNGPAAKTAFALSFLNTVSGLISSGAPGNAVSTILAASGLSADTIAKLSGPLKAGVELGLLQIGLLGVATALGVPGLLSQVVENSAAGSAINQNLNGQTGTTINQNLNGQASSTINQNLNSQAGSTINPNLANPSGYGLNDVLKNTISVNFLKQKLTDYIVGQGVWLGSTASQLINGAINKILGKNDFLNNTEWAINLVRGFKALGLDDSTSAALTDVAQDFVRSEQLNPDLDTAYNQQSINDQALQDDIYQQQDVQDSLNTIAQSEDAQNADYTLRDLRDDLITQLQIQGDDLATSRKNADLVLDSIRSEQLKSSFNSENINSDQLKASIITGLEAKGSSHAEAVTTADTVTANVIAQDLNSELLTREAIASALKLAGINTQTASDLSEQASLALNNVNPLRDIRSAQVLTGQALTEALNTEIINKLKKSIGIDDATAIANQLTLLILGTPNTNALAANPNTSIANPNAPTATPGVDTENEIVADQVTRPTSVLNQINSAIGEIRKAYGDKAADVLTAAFRDFKAPTLDLFILADALRDPGTSLQFVGIMYKGEGNVKIDVRV